MASSYRVKVAGIFLSNRIAKQFWSLTLTKDEKAARQVLARQREKALKNMHCTKNELKNIPINKNI